VRRPVTADLLIGELDRLATVHGYSAVLHCHNSPEPACQATADRAGERAGPVLIPLGQPWRHGYAESFDVRVRDECLTPLGYHAPARHAGARGTTRLVSAAPTLGSGR
jgi:putative transposase